MLGSVLEVACLDRVTVTSPLLLDITYFILTNWGNGAVSGTRHTRASVLG